MKKNTYTQDGIIYVEWLPDNAPPSDSGMGVSVSYTPDDIQELFPDLPEQLTVRLLTFLQKRGMIEYRDYLKPTANAAIQSAWRALYKSDTVKLVDKARKGIELWELRTQLT